MEKPDKNKLVIYVEDDEKYEIKAYAAKKHTSITQLVLDLIRKDMDKEYWSKETQQAGAGR
jgi:hypothetical protein